MFLADAVDLEVLDVYDVLVVNPRQNRHFIDEGIDEAR